MGLVGLGDHPASEERREPVQIVPQPTTKPHFGTRPQVRIRRDAERQQRGVLQGLMMKRAGHVILWQKGILFDERTRAYCIGGCTPRDRHWSGHAIGRLRRHIVEQAEQAQPRDVLGGGDGRQRSPKRNWLGCPSGQDPVNHSSRRRFVRWRPPNIIPKFDQAKSASLSLSQYLLWSGTAVHHREGRRSGSYPRRAAFLRVGPSHE